MWILIAPEIDRREEVLPEKEREAERHQGKTDEAASEDKAMRERESQEAEVALPKPFEIMLEPLLEAAKEPEAPRLALLTARRVMMLNS